MTFPLRVAFVTVEPPEIICGKNTSLSRLSHGLVSRGVTVISLSTHRASRAQLLADLRAFRPQVVHAFHAFKAGGHGLSLAEDLGLPLVITITGTDLNQAVYDPARRAETLRNLQKACHLVCPNSQTVTRLREEFGLQTPASAVSKSVVFPDRTIHFDREGRKIGREEIVFLLPAGFRKVKNNLFPMAPLARLRGSGVPVRLIFIGHAIERDYFEQFQKERAGHPWVDCPGESAREEMYSWYQLADVVLNTSHSEGGSNVVLEAMATQRCVLASDVVGNRAYIDFRPDTLQQSTGLLYRTTPRPADPIFREHDAEDFRAKAEALATQPELRARVGDNAARAIASLHSLDAEIEGYLKAYTSVVSVAEKDWRIPRN